MTDELFYTYMVRCSDGSLYTGWTTDLEQRVRAHNGEIGGGAKYTRSRRPVELVWSTPFRRKQEAQAMEHQVKRMSKAEKNALVAAYTK